MTGGRYYTELAAAFVRGKLADAAGLSDEDAINAGKLAGLRLHKFKRNAELPRVRRVLGALSSIAPSTLLDIGSGRGAFLWALMNRFPQLIVTAIDIKPVRVLDFEAVKRGGVQRLSAALMDGGSLGFATGSFDVVTILEVLEHMPNPQSAIREAVRTSRQFVLGSMPSKVDDNPEHIHLFDEKRARDAFTDAGASKVVIEYVPNHLIILART